MTGSFGDDEFFDDEWVDVYDVEGRKTSLRHLATVHLNGKTYMILGEIQENLLENGRLMLVREDLTVDGATEYVVAYDAAEVEHVMGHFAMRLLLDHVDELPEDIARELSQMDLDIEDMADVCGCRHHAGEFCYCGDPQYLQ